MRDTLHRIKQLVSQGALRVSDHGDEELKDDRIAAGDAKAGLDNAELVEDYPDTGRGPSVLVLEKDRNGKPIHVVWGIFRDDPAGRAVLITAYRPDLTQWTDDFKRRRQ